ncbi:putative epoxide hydrolase [Trichoderma sp. SZMC 28014]
MALPFNEWSSIRVKTTDTSFFARYDGTGPVILLLHGCLQHSLMRHKVGPLLSSKYTVIAPDLPGMGQSTLMAVFAYDKGASVGSVLAWEYTDRVASLSKDFLNWYFWHSSYAAGALISPDHVERYAAALSKPGYLRSMTEFLNGNIWREVEYFKPLKGDPIQIPLAVLWGEATDENPKWLATFIDQNVAGSVVEPSAANLAYLKNEVTMI